MATFIQFILGLLVEGYEFIESCITFIMGVFLLGRIYFDGSPLLTIIPVAGVVMVIKFILKGGK